LITVLARHDVSAAGNHTVRLDYASATAQTVQVKVNGGSAVTVSLPATGSATATAPKTLGLTLTAGSNVVIDRLSVVR
jgi:alpha-glucosidase